MSVESTGNLNPDFDTTVDNADDAKVTAAGAREMVLRKAAEAVKKDRNSQYGAPGDNFATITYLWNGYLAPKFIKDRHYIITPQDVAMMMILLKTARVATGQFNRDNFVDIAGYAACASSV